MELRVPSVWGVEEVLSQGSMGVELELCGHTGCVEGGRGLAVAACPSRP